MKTRTIELPSRGGGGLLGRSSCSELAEVWAVRGESEEVREEFCEGVRVWRGETEGAM
jgi:hypothetical protein